MAKTVTLHFLGKQYDLRADDPADDVESVVRYVEKVMAETEAQHKGLSPQKITVLAAMQMGRDYVRERRRNRELQALVKNKSASLAHRIDDILPDDDV